MGIPPNIPLCLYRHKIKKHRQKVQLKYFQSKIKVALSARVQTKSILLKTQARFINKKPKVNTVSKTQVNPVNQKFKKYTII